MRYIKYFEISLRHVLRYYMCPYMSILIMFVFKTNEKMSTANVYLVKR